MRVVQQIATAVVDGSHMVIYALDDEGRIWEGCRRPGGFSWALVIDIPQHPVVTVEGDGTCEPS